MRGLWDYFKKICIHIIGISEAKEREYGVETF